MLSRNEHFLTGQVYALQNIVNDMVKGVWGSRIPESEKDLEKTLSEILEFIENTTNEETKEFYKGFYASYQEYTRAYRSLPRKVEYPAEEGIL